MSDKDKDCDHDHHDEDHDEINPMQAEEDNSPAGRIERSNNRRRMARVALISMIVVTLLMLFVVKDNRLEHLADMTTWFFMTMASIVGAYMGFTTWAYIANKNKDS
jgi:cation transport ATPase